MEAIKFHNLQSKTKFYQAGTSEMYGKVQKIPQDEKTEFYPVSPYGVAKLYAHWITKNYRKLMVFLHAMAFCLITKVPEEEKHLLQKKLFQLYVNQRRYKQKTFFGNLKAKRDWGHAKIIV